MNSGVSMAGLMGEIKKRRERMDHRLSVWKMRGENQFIFRTKYANDRAESIISGIVKDFAAQAAQARLDKG